MTVSGSVINASELLRVSQSAVSRTTSLLELTFTHEMESFVLHEDPVHLSDLVYGKKTTPNGSDVMDDSLPHALRRYVCSVDRLSIHRPA